MVGPCYSLHRIHRDIWLTVLYCCSASQRNKEHQRRIEAHGPVVAALVELEETACLGTTSMERHVGRLQHQLDVLRELRASLHPHQHVHGRVASARDRARVGRTEGQPTEEVLRIAVECEGTCRWIANQALASARKERSVLDAYKADLQRSVLLCRRIRDKHHRQDRADTTFRTWSATELKTGQACGA